MASPPCFQGVNIGEGMEPFLRWGVTTNYSDKVDSIVRTMRASAGSKFWGWTNHAMCGWGEWNIHVCLQSVLQLTHEGNMPRNGPLANAGLAQKDLRSDKNSMDWCKPHGYGSIFSRGFRLRCPALSKKVNDLTHSNSSFLLLLILRITVTATPEMATGRWTGEFAPLALAGTTHLDRTYAWTPKGARTIWEGLESTEIAGDLGMGSWNLILAHDEGGVQSFMGIK